MKKIISLLILFTMLFSVIGTNFIAYAEDGSFTVSNNSELAVTLEHRNEPLLDRINGQGLNGGELALRYVHNKITLSGITYIIAQNATANEKNILLQEIPKYDGSNRNEINRIKNLKLKTIEDILNRPITGAQLSYLTNKIIPWIQEIEMGLSGRELAGIWQTKLTREGFDYLLEQNGSTREKTLARELRNFTNQRDNAETDGNQAVLGLGSGEGFQLLMRIISRGITKTQLQYLVDNNMLDYVIPEDNEGLNISVSTQDPNVSKIESPEEREARLKREKKTREKEAAKLKEEASQKNQDQQEKLGGLSESLLFELLSERKTTNDGLEFLITLRGNLTKQEKTLILKESVIKKVISKKTTNLRIQLESKLSIAYDRIFQKLARGGLTKEQNNNFAKFIKIEVEKKDVISTYDINTLLHKEFLTKEELKFIIKNNYISNEGITSILNLRGYTSNIGSRRVCGNNPNEETCLRVLINGGLTTNQYFFFKRDGKITNKKFIYSYIEEENDGDIVVDSDQDLPEVNIGRSNFLEKVNDSEKSYKINFKDLTAGGKVNVYKTFERPALFPKKIILPEGINFKLKDVKLDEIFNKNNLIKQKISENNLNLKVTSFDPSLKVLGDRLVFTKKTQISFKSKNELETIQNTLGKEIGISNLQGTESLQNEMNSNNEVGRNYYINNSKIENKLKTKFNGSKLGNFTNVNVNDPKIINGLIRDCKIKNGQSSNKCTKNYIENYAAKTITVEDTVEYGLIPPTYEEVKSGNYLLKRKLGTFNMNVSEINSRFKKLKNILGKIKEEKEEYTKLEDGNKINVYTLTGDREYCKNTYTNQEDINTCIDQKNELNKETIAYYDKYLLNGFTLGSEKSVGFNTSYSVWGTTIFKLSVDLYYSFGFGIRIPIAVGGSIKDNLLVDTKNKRPYQSAIYAYTFDGDKDFYKNIGLSDDQIFDGKEFVLKAGAGIKVHLFVKYLVNTDLDLGLMTLLVLLEDYDFLNNAGITDSSDVVKLGIPASSLNGTNEISLFGESIKLSDFIGNDPNSFVCDEKESTADMGIKETSCSYKELVDDNTEECTLIPYSVNKMEKVHKKVYTYCSNADAGTDPIDYTYKVLKTRKELLVYLSFHNSLDLGKNFVPPFGGKNRMKLFDFSTPAIPLTNPSFPFVLLGKIGLKSFLDGRITVKCDEVNSDGGCPVNKSRNSNTSQGYDYIQGYDASRLHIDTKAVYTGTGIAILPKKTSLLSKGGKFLKEGTLSLGENDKLGKYAKFGVKFDDFRYHPKVDFTLYARAGAQAKLPIVGTEEFWTDDIDIYTYSISSDNIYLSKHKGTDGVFDMSTNNKIYSADGTLSEVKGIQIFETPNRDNPLIMNHKMVIFPPVNYEGANKTYYLIGNSHNLRNISCSDISGLKEYKGGFVNVFDELNTKSNGLERGKNYTDKYENIIKVISCDTTRLQETNVFTKIYDIDNHYFDPYLVKGDAKFYSVGSGKTLKFNKELNTTNNTLSSFNFKIGANEFDKDNGDTIRYIFTKNTPSEYISCYHGRIYNEGESLILGKIGDNPILSQLKGTYYLNMIRCTRKNNTFLQSYKKMYTIIIEDAKINNLGNGLELGDTLDKTTLKEKVGGLEGGGIGDTLPGQGGINGGDNPAGGLGLDQGKMQTMFAGFNGQFTNPGFMGGLNNLLLDGDIDMGAIVGMNTMIFNGDMGGGGMGILAGMKNKSAGKMTSGFRKMLNGGQISKNGLLSIQSMSISGKITKRGLTELASLYNQYGVSYVGKKVKGKNAFHTMNVPGTQSNLFIKNLEYTKIAKKNTKMTGLVTSVGGKNQSTYNGVPYFVNKSGKQDEIFFPYLIWHKSLLNDWGEYRVEKIVNGNKYNLGNTRTVDDDSTTHDLDKGKYSDLLGVENGNIFYYSAALNRFYSTNNSFRSKVSFTLPIKAKQHNGHLIDIYMFDIYDKNYVTYLDKLNNINILKYTDHKLNKTEIKQNDLRKIYGSTDDININKIGFIKNNNDYNYYIITDKGLLLYNINFDNDGTIEKSIIKKIDGDLGYNGYARGFSYDYENNIIFYFKYNAEKTFNSLYALNVNVNNNTFGKTISILDGSFQKLKIKGISKEIGENKLGLLISSPSLSWYDDIEIGSLTYSVNKQETNIPLIIDVNKGDYIPGTPNVGFDTGGDTNSNKTSSDEYVNKKLNEINNCFKSNYDSHLDNITKTISTFKNNADMSRDKKIKDKYQKAIDKLEEIKKLFLNRYKFILDYDDGNFGEKVSNGDDQNGEVEDDTYKEEDKKNRVYDDNNTEVKQGNTGGFTSEGGTFKIHY